jgi:hypothetical protein
MVSGPGPHAFPAALLSGYLPMTEQRLAPISSLDEQQIEVQSRGLLPGSRSMIGRFVDHP